MMKCFKFLRHKTEKYSKGCSESKESHSGVPENINFVLRMVSFSISVQYMVVSKKTMDLIPYLYLIANISLAVLLST